MPTRKVFLELKAADYSAGRFTIDVRSLDIKNPLKIGVVNSTVKLGEDSDYLMIFSDALSKLHKNALAGSNDGFQRLVYTLVPEQRIVRSASQTTQQTTGVSDSLISSMGTDLLMWWDMAPSRLLDSNFAEVDTVGDQVSFYYNRSPAPSNLLFVTSYGTGLQLANVGSTKGVTRSGSWESIVDSTLQNPILTDEFAYHTLVTMPSSLSTISYLVDNGPLKVYTWASGTINFRNSSDVNTNVSLSWVPLRSYVLSIQRRTGTQDHDGDQQIDAYEYYWRLEDLSSGNVQTATTIVGWPVPQGGQSSWRIGRANYHFDHTQSCVVCYSGDNSTYWDNSIDWLKAQYSGNVEVTNQVVTQTHTYQLFAQKKEIFECKSHSEPLQFIDLQFKNDGNIVQPLSGLIELEISE